MRTLIIVGNCFHYRLTTIDINYINDHLKNIVLEVAIRQTMPVSGRL